MMAYRDLLRKQFETLYGVAQLARAKGIDPSDAVEIVPAIDFSQRVEILTGPPGVGAVISEYVREGLSREEIAFKVGERIVDGEFGDAPPEKLAEQAVRTGLAIITSGIVAGPVEGIDRVRVLTNEDGGKYLQIIFNGPIRSCGGTATGLGVILCATAARKLGFAPYKPTNLELARYVEEMLVRPPRQYIADQTTLAKETEIVVRNSYVAISSGPSVSIEEQRLASIKNLPNIDDHARNYVRDTVCIVIQEGILLKAPKLLKIVRKLGLDGWEWLADVGKGRIVQTEAHSDAYLSQLVGGRPVFSIAGMPGGFALRYGRSRHGGLYCFSVHPSVTYVADGYPAVGVQLKTSYPSKGATLQICDRVAPPFVRLKNGDCKYLHSAEEAMELHRRGEIEKILFLGEILISFGDICESGNVLLPGAWCTEWYVQYLERVAGSDSIPQDMREKILRIIENPDCYVSPADAFDISRATGVPLHPRYTYAFNWTSLEEIKMLHEAVRAADCPRLPKRTKQALEEILVEHISGEDYIVLEKDDFDALKLLFRGEGGDATTPLDYVRNTSGIKIMDKYPTIIGCRLGRPPNIISFSSGRRMKPPVHVLFPVGDAGGPSRLINKAARAGKITVTAQFFLCPSCGETLPYRYCFDCEARCKPVSDTPLQMEIDIKSLYEKACKRTGVPPETNTKGVIGLTSDTKIAAPIEKGLLRAKYSLYCFRDETIRVDIVNEPLTAFRPNEIQLSVEKARELGYTEDIYGNPLTSGDQLVHMYEQDLVLPEEAADVFVRMAKYTDELLEKVYGLAPFYRVNSKEDLIGHLFFAISPHTAAAVVLRLIGFCKARVMYNHPMAISERRRDADSDSDGVTLVLPALLDFSRKYLPNRPGMLEDTPIISIVNIDPTEVDTQAYGVDTVARYPLELYEAALRREQSSAWRDKIPCIGTKLGSEDPFRGYMFTHDTSNINLGETVCRYQEKTPDGKKKTMVRKVMDEINMLRKLRSIIMEDVVTMMVRSHLIPDFKGCMRAYSMQTFRCTKCNATYRRMPLSGRCSRCDRPLIQTVHRGTVIKYLWLIRYLGDLIKSPDILEETKEYIMMAEQFFGRGTIEEIKSKTLAELDFHEAPAEEEAGEEE